MFSQPKPLSESSSLGGNSLFTFGQPGKPPFSLGQTPTRAPETNYNLGSGANGLFSASLATASTSSLFRNGSSQPTQGTVIFGETPAVKTANHTPFTTSLTKSYDESVRPFIDLIDSLRKLGVNEDVALPTIIALGDQSSGKSSILEAISGVQLPRGSGLVTRCPLSMQLKRLQTSDKSIWNAEISHSECGKPVIITDPNVIGKEIERAQDLLTGGDKRLISEELITLKISSPDVPDLSLIDLPGLVRCATKDQPEDVDKQIRNIVLKYASSEETVILCVIPLNQDSATIEAYQIAQQVDPKGRRTLGVLTKPDLVEEAKELEALEVARNQGGKTLVKGYTTVKCRAQKDINNKMTLDNAILEEENFFRTHKYFNTLDKSQRGIHTLADKLSEELILHIKKCLPDLKDQIKKKLNDAQQKLHSLPSALPDKEADKRLFFMKLVMEFNQYLDNVLNNGSLFPSNIFDVSSIQKEKLNKDVHTFYIWRKIYKQLKKDIQTTTDGALETFGNIGIQALVDEMEIQRGCELPGFQNYKIFENLVLKHISKYEEFIQQCMCNISDNTEKLLHHIAKERFDQFPFLLTRVLDEANIVREECLADAEMQLKFILERERLVYSQDDTYVEQLEIVEQEIAEAESKKLFAKFSNENSGDKNANILHNLLLTYFTVANKRICDEVPSTLRICLQRRFSKKLQEKLFSIAAEQTSASTFIKEDVKIELKRLETQKVYDRLHEAKTLLSKFIN